MNKYIALIQTAALQCSVPLDAESLEAAWKQVVEARSAGLPLQHKLEGQNQMHGVWLDGTAIVRVMTAEDFQSQQRQAQLNQGRIIETPGGIRPVFRGGGR